jgi:hypothetical protein
MPLVGCIMPLHPSLFASDRGSQPQLCGSAAIEPVIKLRLNGIDKAVNVEPENLRFEGVTGHR